jgi:hypothetical protein
MRGKRLDKPITLFAFSKPKYGVRQPQGAAAGIAVALSLLMCRCERGNDLLEAWIAAQRVPEWQQL